MALRVSILYLGLGAVAQATFPQQPGTPPAQRQQVAQTDRRSLPEKHDRLSDEARPYYCYARDLPTSWAFEPPPLLIEQHEVYFFETGRTLVSLRFRNTGKLSIQALALILSYVDERGEAIDEVPVAGVTKMPPEGFDSPFPVSLSELHLAGVQDREHREHALRPRGSARVAGSRDGTRTGNCPARAKVTFLRLQFTDGTARTYSSPGWHLGPIPRRIPEVPTTFRPLSVNRPSSIVARVKIGASGDVADVVPDNSNNHPEVLRWIRDFMKQEWKFHPAVLGGTPVDSQLTVLFRFPAGATLEFPEVEPILSPVTLIQFFRRHDLHPNDYTGSDLVVMYGQADEGTLAE